MPMLVKYNKDFFKEWNPDMAYILGFLYADGNIIKTKRDTHFVSLQIKDRPILESIKASLKSDHKIHVRTHKGESGLMYRLQIGSKEYFQDLVALGLIPNKTKRMRLPNIPKVFVGDFIRGYFDGDGNVWTGYVHKERKVQTVAIQAVFTSCSKEFLNDIKTLLKSFGIEGGSLYTPKKGTYSRLLYSILDALKLYEIMYNGSYKLVLERKRLVFERFMHTRL
jgi:intein/homing endonuclease